MRRADVAGPWVAKGSRWCCSAPSTFYRPGLDWRHRGAGQPQLGERPTRSVLRDSRGRRRDSRRIVRLLAASRQPCAKGQRLPRRQLPWRRSYDAGDRHATTRALTPFDLGLSPVEVDGIQPWLAVDLLSLTSDGRSPARLGALPEAGVERHAQRHSAQRRFGSCGLETARVTRLPCWRDLESKDEDRSAESGREPR